MAKTAITALVECSTKYFDLIGKKRIRDYRYTDSPRLEKGYYEWIDIYESCFCVSCTVSGKLSIQFYETHDTNAKPDFSICYQNLDYQRASTILNEVGDAMLNLAYEAYNVAAVVDVLSKVTSKF